MYPAICGPKSVTPISEVNWVSATATTCRFGLEITTKGHMN